MADSQVFATIMNFRGEVKFNGKSVSKGQQVKEFGLLETGASSFVKVELGANKNIIVLGANGSMDLGAGKDYKTQRNDYLYTLQKGLCRWVTGAKDAKDVPKLHTKNAIMGVRGTDYLVEVDPLLGETQLIVLDGKVMLENRNKSADKKLISKGQWGGIGGRFGSEIGEIIDLPKAAIEQFSKKLLL